MSAQDFTTLHITMRLTFGFLLWFAVLLPVCLIYTDNTADWGDDWACYYAEARNISAHLPVGQTHFRPVDYNGHYAPPCYPAGYPLLLAAAVRPGIPDMEHLGLYMSIWCAVWMALVAGIISHRWGVLSACCLVIIFLLSPYVLQTKGRIWSDIPFSIAFLAGLWLYTRRDGPVGTFLAGLCLGAAISMRSIGWVAVLAIYTDAAIDLIRAGTFARAYLRPLLWMTAGALIVPGFIHIAYPLPTDTYYLKQFSYSTITHTFQNLQTYFQTFRFFLTTGTDSGVFSVLLTVLILVVMVIGLIAARRDGILAYALLLTLGMIFIFPDTQDMRYLLPVLPLAMYYLAAGAQRLSRPYYHAGYIVLVALTICITWQRVPAYTTMWQRKAREHTYGPFTRDSRLGMAAIADLTRGHGRIVCVAPRVVALLTSHDCSVIPEGDLPHQLAVLLMAEPAYILSIDQRDADATDRLAIGHGDSLIYADHGFRLYRCRP
ncbi:MAG: hypothetical protein JSS76_07140 [Bacteroidetes bacterium]|nr:hypothetical protein [Bacteroidota bacterium]